MEAGDIIERMTIITITDMTMMSGTSTAMGTIMILYGCLVPLGLSNRVWWGKGGLRLVSKDIDMPAR